jgi:SAM-dependent methyltransferase
VRWADAEVVEVGSLNVNGRARDYVPRDWRSWIGIDLHAGPGVDIVGDAIDVLTPDSCDIIVSAEVLEHCPDWVELVWSMVTAVRPGGSILITCAGTGRPEHGADGGSVKPGEHYRNVTGTELCAALPEWVHVVHVEDVDGDTRLLGRVVRDTYSTAAVTSGQMQGAPSPG